MGKYGIECRVFRIKSSHREFDLFTISIYFESKWQSFENLKIASSFQFKLFSISYAFHLHFTSRANLSQ